MVNSTADNQSAPQAQGSNLAVARYKVVETGSAGINPAATETQPVTNEAAPCLQSAQNNAPATQQSVPEPFVAAEAKEDGK